MSLFYKNIRGAALLILLGLSLFTSGQLVKSDRYDQVDKKVLKLLLGENLTIDSVITFANSNFTNQEDKVRAYYTFISLYISYDIQRLDELKTLPGVASFDGPLHYTLSQNPKDVFASRKGVCEGISRLMVKLCEGSGIQSEMVVGFCKTPDGEIVKDMGHAWNAVKLDSAWALVDITWSFGYVNHNKEFIRERSDRYFCVKPETFVLDHLPMDPMWQLSSRPVSRTYFYEGDTLNGKFFSENYHFNDSINAYYKKNEFGRNYSSLLHYYAFDQKNPDIARNVDVYINNQVAVKTTVASVYYDEFVTFYNTKLVVNCSKANCRKALDMLYSSQSNLKQAQAILKNKTALTPEFAAIFKTMNQEIKKNNISINQNIQVVKELQKRAK